MDSRQAEHIKSIYTRELEQFVTHIVGLDDIDDTQVDTWLEASVKAYRAAHVTTPNDGWSMLGDFVYQAHMRELIHRIVILGGETQQLLDVLAEPTWAQMTAFFAAASLSAPLSPEGGGLYGYTIYKMAQYATAPASNDDEDGTNWRSQLEEQAAGLMRAYTIFAPGFEPAFLRSQVDEADGNDDGGKPGAAPGSDETMVPLTLKVVNGKEEQDIHVVVPERYVDCLVVNPQYAVHFPMHAWQCELTSDAAYTLSNTLRKVKQMNAKAIKEAYGGIRGFNALQPPLELVELVKKHRSRHKASRQYDVDTPNDDGAQETAPADAMPPQASDVLPCTPE